MTQKNEGLGVIKDLDTAEFTKTYDYYAGPKIIRNVPLDSLIVLPQIRSVYNSEAADNIQKAIDGRDIDSDKNLSVDLFHCPMVGVLDYQEFKQYLDDHNKYYGTDSLDPSNYSPGPSGLYFVVISGNTRTKVMRNMCREAGVDESAFAVVCSLKPGIDFHTANRNQARENTYYEPSEHDIAYNISNEYKYRVRMARRLSQGPTYYSHKSIASHFGCNPEKVGRALKYVELPQEVRNLVEDIDQEQPLVTYSVAIALHPYMLAYAKHYNLDINDESVENAVMVLLGQYMNEKLSTGTNLSRFKDVIKARIKSLALNDCLEAETLFIEEDLYRPSNIDRLRKNTEKKLAQAAIKTLEWLDNGTEVWTPELTERLLSLASRAGALTLSSELESETKKTNPIEAELF